MKTEQKHVGKTDDFGDASLIDAREKYENYREQFGRLKRAMQYKFYLEAIFIEYSIMEDRTESILRHSNKWDAYLKNRKDHGVTIDSKIKYIEKMAENKKSPLRRYFDEVYFSELLAWKENRNKLIHALLKQHLEHNEVQQLAIEGEKLAKDLRTKTGCYNRYIDKHGI